MVDCRRAKLDTGPLPPPAPCTYFFDPYPTKAINELPDGEVCHPHASVAPSSPGAGEAILPEGKQDSID